MTPSSTATTPETATPTATPSVTTAPTSTPTPTAAIGTIRGAVWLDANGDGTRGPNEPGLPGGTIERFENGRQIAVATTAEDGGHAFLRLSPGIYAVREVNPAWLRYSTTSDEAPAEVRDGQTVTVDFGDWFGLRSYLPLIFARGGSGR